MIEDIINGEDFLLITNNGEMITQNACCNMAKLTTLDYFITKNKNIEKYNDIIKSLSSIKQEISNYSKSNTIFINKNTKIQYPIVQNAYSKENIYKSFLKYCKFNSGIKLNETFMRICKTNKSKFLKSDSIESLFKNLLLFVLQILINVSFNLIPLLNLQYFKKLLYIFSLLYAF
jgi:hypothetical protein